MSDWQPRRIIQIVSGSRSGSTLLKSLLAQSPSVCSLDGEEEPYIKLAGNGYGFNSDSDEIDFAKTPLRNKKLIRRQIYEELTTQFPWKHRLKLQYKGTQLYELLDNLHKMRLSQPEVWLFERGILGNYDTGPEGIKTLFDGELVYEMKPYIIPSVGRGVKDTLLLKCPYNVYRPGILKQLYPKSEVTRVFLMRNPAAIINGLYDGWKARYGFHKHLTPYGWWKFDLPPGWQSSAATVPTIHKCLFQFRSSYTAMYTDKKQDDVVCNFEEFVTDTEEAVDLLCYQLEIEPPKPLTVKPVMSTGPIDIDRWKRRASLILPLLERDLTSVNLADWMGYDLQEIIRCR